MLVKDIREELGLLRQVFQEQLQVVRELAEAFWPSKTPKAPLSENEGLTKDDRRSLRDRFRLESGLEALIDRVKYIDQEATATLSHVSWGQKAV